MSQFRSDHDNLSTEIGPSDIRTEVGKTIDQYIAFGKNVAEYTVIAKSATGTYVIMTANDGTEQPIALLKGTIPQADIEAGDVEDQILFISGRDFKEADIVIENSLTLDTAIPFHGTANADLTIREMLRSNGITTRKADTVTGYENS